MSEQIRSFIAVKLPEPVLHRVQTVQTGLKEYGFNIRWVKPAGIHLTLKFLGDITIDRFDLIGQAMAAAVKPIEPFKVSAKGLGVFPGWRRPRIIWAGLTGQVNQLLALHKNIEQQLQSIGFVAERRPFKGHLTLGRIKGHISPRQLATAIDAYAEFESEPFQVDGIILFRSVLQPSGAVYSEIMHTTF